MIESSTWRHRCQACPWSWRGQPNPARWKWGCQCRCRWVKHPTKKPCWDGRPWKAIKNRLLYTSVLSSCTLHTSPMSWFSIIFIDRFQAKWVVASRMLLVGPSRQLRLLRVSLATKCIKALVPLLVESVRRWQVWHGEGEKRNCSQCSLRFPEVVSGKNRTTAHYRIYRSVESDSSRQFGSAVTDHVLQLLNMLNQLLPAVFAAHPVARPAYCVRKNWRTMPRSSQRRPRPRYMACTTHSRHSILIAWFVDVCSTLFCSDL